MIDVSFLVIGRVGVAEISDEGLRQPGATGQSDQVPN